jgi:hypothetical protein
MVVPAAFTFWQQLVLNAAGPLLTLVFGTFLITWMLDWRRSRVEARRFENNLRESLIDDVVSAISEAVRSFERRRASKDDDAARKSGEEFDDRAVKVAQYKARVAVLFSEQDDLAAAHNQAVEQLAVLRDEVYKQGETVLVDNYQQDRVDKIQQAKETLLEAGLSALRRREARHER